MKKFVVGLPGLSGGLEGESVLRGFSPLEPVLECGKVVRLLPFEGRGVAEAAWLGVDPGAVGMEQGPLTVAALGFDPPDRSVHFHLSLMTVDETGVLGEVLGGVLKEEVRDVIGAAEKLATNRLVPVRGRGVDHGLVWEEGSLDLGVTSTSDAAGKVWRTVLPEGDGERLLRGFIDDSLNLLDGLEMNRRRAGEGLEKLNVLWPWGFGFRQSLPNLALRRGEVAMVYGQSLRLEGLTRLLGYRFDSGRLTKGVHVSEEAWRRFGRESAGVLVSPKSDEMRRAGRLEELSFELETMVEELLKPLWAARETDPFRLALVSPGLDGGLGLSLVVDSRVWGANALPFDERVLDDPRVSTLGAAEVVAGVLSP